MNLTGTQEKRTQVLKHHKDTLFQLQTGWESCGEVTKVWAEKNATGLKTWHRWKTITCIVWPWNLVKMISSCEGYFDKVS